MNEARVEFVHSLKQSANEIAASFVLHLILPLPNKIGVFVCTSEFVCEVIPMNRAVRLLQSIFCIPLLSTTFSLLCVNGSYGQAAPSVEINSSKPAPAAAAPDAASAPLPKFEVATIKPTKSDDGNTMMMFTADGISIHGVPMKMLLRESFGIEDDRIIGEPGWVKDRFDIEAKVDADDAPKLKAMKIDQRRAMLLPMLEERFNMKYHHETRELPIYALVVAKGGVKMKAAAPDDDPPKAADGSKADAPKSDAPKPDAAPNSELAPKAGAPAKAKMSFNSDDGPAKDKPRMGKHMLMMNGPGQIESTATGLPFLVHLLAEQLGRTVEDKTGLTGNFDYTLKWTPDEVGTPMGGDAGPGKPENSTDAGGPTLITALEEQLGLKLEATKQKVDVIVIDHIDQPSQN